jgi:hypothetical protein
VLYRCAGETGTVMSLVASENSDDRIAPTDEDEATCIAFTFTFIFTALIFQVFQVDHSQIEPGMLDHVSDLVSAAAGARRRIWGAVVPGSGGSSWDSRGARA